MRSGCGRERACARRAACLKTVTGGNGLDAKFIIVVAAVGLVCFLAGLAAGSRRRQDGRMIVQQSPLAPADGSPPPLAPAAQRVAPGSVNIQLGRDLEQLLSAGKKIEAIKLVRERTGMGLKEAKDAVERLEDLIEKRLKTMIDEKALESRQKAFGE